MTSWIIYGAVAILMLGAAWGKGYMTGKESLYEYQADQAKNETRIAKAREIVTTQVVTNYVKVAGKTTTITETVEKEVIKYADANPGYCLDGGWRGLHDAAAVNRLPDTAPGAYAALSAPRAAEAIATVTANYSGCHQTADRLDALQEWVKKQAAVR